MCSLSIMTLSLSASRSSSWVWSWSLSSWTPPCPLHHYRPQWSYVSQPHLHCNPIMFADATLKNPFLNPPIQNKIHASSSSSSSSLYHHHHHHHRYHHYHHHHHHHRKIIIVDTTIIIFTIVEANLCFAPVDFNLLSPGSEVALGWRALSVGRAGAGELARVDAIMASKQ